MSSCINQSGVRSMITGPLGSHAPSVMDVRYDIVRSPFRLEDGRVARTDVLKQKCGRARNAADRLGAAEDRNAVPDRHVPDGKVSGGEMHFEGDWSGAATNGYGRSLAVT